MRKGGLNSARSGTASNKLSRAPLSFLHRRREGGVVAAATPSVAVMDEPPPPPGRAVGPITSVRSAACHCHRHRPRPLLPHDLWQAPSLLDPRFAIITALVPSYRRHHRHSLPSPSPLPPRSPSLSCGVMEVEKLKGVEVDGVVK